MVAMLGADERNRAAAFHFAADRASYIAGHWLLRRMLTDLAGECLPFQWRFGASRFGKPELAPGQTSVDLRFNLSHARGMAVAAVGIDVDVGVDVEALDRQVTDELAIADSYFCRSESVYLHGIDNPAQRKRAFIDLWTAKEALVKADGRGMSLPLDSFSVDLQRCGDDSARLARVDGRNWSLRRWQVGQHVVALAIGSGQSGKSVPVDGCTPVSLDGDLDAHAAKPGIPGNPGTLSRLSFLAASAGSRPWSSHDC